MDGGLPLAAARAIGGTLGSESEEPAGAPNKSTTLASESNPHEWFYRAACALLGKDPGLQLHILTGYPVSSCSAYAHHDAQKRRRPPEHFIRAICHAEQGFFDAFMGECHAPWWLELNRSAHIGRKVLDLTRGE